MKKKRYNFDAVRFLYLSHKICSNHSHYLRIFIVSKNQFSIYVILLLSFHSWFSSILLLNRSFVCVRLVFIKDLWQITFIRFCTRIKISFYVIESIAYVRNRFSYVVKKAGDIISACAIHLVSIERGVL